MGLADELFAANASYYADGYDELGLYKRDTVDYIVARTLALSHQRRKDAYSPHQLHLRGDTIYDGNKQVAETRDNIYRYSLYEGAINPAWQILYWIKLKQHLPILNPDVIQISPHLFWVKSEGRVVNDEEISEIYGKVKR